MCPMSYLWLDGLNGRIRNKDLNQVTFLPEVHDTALSLLKSHDLYS